MAERIKYLDGLRGLAALAVIVEHWSCNFLPSFVLIWNHIFYISGVSVCVFFVLSGYVLTYGYFEKHDRKIIISSALRRYFRFILPMMFSVICFIVITLLIDRYGYPFNDETASMFNMPINLSSAVWQILSASLIVLAVLGSPLLKNVLSMRWSHSSAKCPTASISCNTSFLRHWELRYIIL